MLYHNDCTYVLPKAWTFNLFVFQQLNKPLEFNEYVGQIGLPQKDRKIDENTQLIMTGWGTTMGSPIHPVNKYEILLLLVLMRLFFKIETKKYLKIHILSVFSRTKKN